MIDRILQGTRPGLGEYGDKTDAEQEEKTAQGAEKAIPDPVRKILEEQSGLYHFIPSTAARMLLGLNKNRSTCANLV